MLQQEGTLFFPTTNERDALFMADPMSKVVRASDVSAFIEFLDRYDTLSFDTETDSSTGDGLSFNRYIVGFSVAIGSQNGQGWYVPLAHATTVWKPYNLSKVDGLRILRVIFSKGRTIFIHNAKFDLKVCRNAGLEVDTLDATIIDTMLEAWMEGSFQFHGLKPLVAKLFDYKMTEFSAFKVCGATRFAPVPDMAKYAVSDVQWLFPLHECLHARLEKQGPQAIKLRDDLEMPIMRLLEHMEQEGMGLDKPYVSAMKHKISEESELLKIELAKMLNLEVKHLNLGSTQWLSRKMFVEYRWWGIKPSWEPGKKGDYSTKAEVLTEIAAGIISGTTKSGVEFATRLLRFRKLGKLLSTYTDTLIEASENHGAGGRIHASFNQHGTVTGRFSCVHGDTLLETSEGTFRISDLRLTKTQSATILTHRLRRRPILAVIEKGEEEMFEVTLVTGQQILCTAQHRFLTPYGWKRLSELLNGDEVLYAEQGGTDGCKA